MRARALAIALHPAVVSGAVAAATLARQGFEFGLNNNVFHVPIVLGWASLPQFATDPTIRSLSAFVTPVFPALAFVLDETTLRSGFFVLHVLTRLLTCLAIYRLIGICGVESRVWRAGALAVACLVAPAYGFTPVAKAGMFLSYFTHTELAQAAALLALADLASGRVARAGWLAGAAFLVNAFVGVWLLVPLGLASVGLLTTPTRAAGARTLVVGVTGVGLLALPVVVWMWRLPADPVTFDYRAYLAYYFPDHFMLGGQRADEFIRAAGILAGGVSGLVLLPRGGSTAMVRVLGSLLAVFAAGVVVGEFATSRFVLNLHLLRVDGLITWLCLASVGAAVATALAGRRVVASVTAAAVMAALAFDTVYPGALLASVAALALAGLGRSAWPLSWRDAKLGGVTVAALFATTLGLSHWAGWVDRSMPWPIGADDPPTDRHLVGASPARPEWAEVKAWAAAHSTPEAQFLIPPQFEDFRLGSLRRPWVDWKEGAAAMWAPRTYARWRQRIEEVRSLTSVADTMAYADDHAIDFVVLDKRRWPDEALEPLHPRLVFENRWFGVARGR